MIRAKEEPAAASLAASQSPQHAGSLLAGQGTGKKKVIDKCSSLHLPQWLLSSDEPQKKKRQWASERHEDKENQNFDRERSVEKRAEVEEV